MVDINVYNIDGEDYYLLEEIKVNDTDYLYLSKVDDETDFMFRKRSADDKDVLLTLANEKEVKMVALIFANKMLG